MSDMVNNPAHYKTTSGVEAIDVIETWFSGSYHLGNTVKYILRHKNKGKPVEDLRKASWYIARYIKYTKDSGFYPSSNAGCGKFSVSAAQDDALNKMLNAFKLPTMLNSCIKNLVDALHGDLSEHYWDGEKAKPLPTPEARAQRHQHHMVAAQQDLADYICLIEHQNALP